MASTRTLYNAISDFYPRNIVVVDNDKRYESSEFNFQVADVSSTSERKEGSTGLSPTHNFTVAYFEPSEYYFPQFDMQPKQGLQNFVAKLFGIAPVDFPAHPDFSGNYVLFAKVRRTVEKLFTENLIQTLNLKSNYVISARDGAILLSIKGSSVQYSKGANSLSIASTQYRLFRGEERELFAEDARKVFEAFYQAARQTNMTKDNVLDAGVDIDAEIKSASGLMKRILKKVITRQHLELFLSMPTPREFDFRMKKYIDKKVSIGTVIACLVVSTLVPATYAAYVANQKSIGVSVDLFSPVFIVTILISSICLIAAVFRIRSRLRLKRVLAKGLVTKAVISEVRRMPYSVNDVDIWEVEYSYVFDGVEYKNKVKSTGDLGPRAKIRKEKSHSPDILVDPKDPKNSLYTDSLISTSLEVEI